MGVFKKQMKKKGDSSSAQAISPKEIIIIESDEEDVSSKHKTPEKLLQKKKSLKKKHSAAPKKKLKMVKPQEATESVAANVVDALPKPKKSDILLFDGNLNIADAMHQTVPYPFDLQDEESEDEYEK